MIIPPDEFEDELGGVKEVLFVLGVVVLPLLLLLLLPLLLSVVVPLGVDGALLLTSGAEKSALNDTNESCSWNPPVCGEEGEEEEYAKI